MNDLIRTDTVFGKRVNLVGNISADLVLESLGKVYIKSRNKSQTLEELITSLVTQDLNVSTSLIKIVEGIENLDTSEFKDGTFVFDKLSNILYLYLDEELLELINVAPEGTQYVKRSGDTMTGRLSIYVPNGPPLFVNSNTLVPNLNANYLNGYSGTEFAKKAVDEWITGRWKFKGQTEFENNTLFSRDVIVNGSVGSLSFASGFGGFGWRMDADTNTLTIDNLVVRKLMQVYELVVNKISATNGSLWVSNAGKVVFALKLEIYNLNFFSNTDNYKLFYDSLKKGDYFILLGVFETFTPTAEEIQNASGDLEENGPEMYTANCLSNAKIVRIDLDLLQSNESSSMLFFVSDTNSKYTKISLFNLDFKYNTVFPFIPRNAYSDYQININEIKSNKEELLVLEEELAELLARHQDLVESKASLETIDISSQTIANKEVEISSKESTIETLESEALDIKSDLLNYSKPFFKYFGTGDFYIVLFDDEELPVFKIGDLLRCQKWTYKGIKYYDAVVCNCINNNLFIIRIADSILDRKTTITYDSSLNPNIITQWSDKINMTLYELSSNYVPYETLDLGTEGPPKDTEGNVWTEEDRLKYKLLGIVEDKDGLVQIGNLWDPQRQNAVYITSTDDGAPYMDVISGCNRPDYSVIYYVPVYKTIKLNKFTAGNIVGFTGLTDVPYTGDYYILEESVPANACEYTYFLYTQNDITKNYLAKGKIVPTNSVVLYRLSTSPNEYVELGDLEEGFNLLWEDGSKILLENNIGLADNTGVISNTGGYIILEKTISKLTITSTRTTKVRLGNLDGIQDETFPIDKLPYGYGLYGLNVFLTGEFYLNNGRSVASIGQEAIEFAIASAKAGADARALLERDLKRANDLLNTNIYTKGDLLTAGMRIGDNKDGEPGIVLWGNRLIIATTEAELKGNTNPTALFYKGRIDAKFLSLYNIHSALGYGNACRVVLREVSADNERKYYKEQILEYDTSNNTYYYMDGNTREDVLEKDTLPGNTLYGWNLEADGTGYLARGYILWDTNGAGYLANGKISWDLLGLLSIEGNMFIKENENLLHNGIHIINKDGYRTLSISGRDSSNIDSVAHNILNDTTLTYDYPDDTTHKNISGKIYNYDETYLTVSTPVICEKLNELQVTQNNKDITFVFKLNVNSSNSPYVNLNNVHIYLILYFADESTKIYKVEDKNYLYYRIGSKALTKIEIYQKYVDIFVQPGGETPIDEHPIEFTRFYHKVDCFTINMASEIGIDILSLYSSNGIFQFNNNGFKVGYLANKAKDSHSAFVVNEKGVLLLKPGINYNNNIISLKNLLNSSNYIDLLYAVDDSCTCREYISNSSTVDNNTTFTYKCRDANSYVEYYSLSGSNFTIEPKIGENKVHIIRSKGTYNFNISNSSELRVGQTLTIIKMNGLAVATLTVSLYLQIYSYDRSTLYDSQNQVITISGIPLVLMCTDSGSNGVRIWQIMSNGY